MDVPTLALRGLAGRRSARSLEKNPLDLIRWHGVPDLVALRPPLEARRANPPRASWSKTINLHPENNEVLRMSEAEAITDFVGWLRELKGRFSNAKHVLRGHYATTVDLRE